MSKVDIIRALSFNGTLHHIDDIVSIEYDFSGKTLQRIGRIAELYDEDVLSQYIKIDSSDKFSSKIQTYYIPEIKSIKKIGTNYEE